jgi:hypothetical protein
LAAEYGLRIYGTDEVIGEHATRSSPDEHPLTAAFLEMTMDQRWLDRTPTEMARTFHGFQGEMFEMIVQDLLALPREPPILAEGFRLLPRLVQPLLTQSRQAVWLLPTRRFRRRAFASRGSLYAIAGRTSDPERALRNLLMRDALFTEAIAREAAALQLPTIRVDPDLAPSDLAAMVASALGLHQNAVTDNP